MLNLVPYTNHRIGMPSLLGWDPTRFFDDVFGVGRMAPVKVEQDTDHVVVTTDVPGIGPDDLELTFESGDLTISGQRGERTYRYIVTIGDDVDPDKIEAQLDKGVLTVKAGKKPEAKPRKIALRGVEPKSLESGEAKS